MNEFDAIKRHGGWFTILGVALMVLGAIAIVAAVATTLISIMIFGWLLILGGIFQSIHAFRRKSGGGSMLQRFMGVLNLIVGLLIIANPGASALALTLLMAAFFIVGGLFRIVSAAEHHFPGRNWALFSGAINIVLGVLIWLQWPASAFWVLGMFIGIDLILTGWWFVMLTSTARRNDTEPAIITA